MYFGNHKVSDKWGVHVEAQIRRSGIINNSQQLLLRTGINYHLSPNVFATAGYAYIETYPYGDLPSRTTFPEHRIWQQIQMKNQMRAIEYISRFRLEQRYVQLPVLINNEYKTGDAVYTNRFRLLNRFSLPFKGKTIEDRSTYISAYNEFMINFGKNVAYNIFDQNRAYIALGYKIPKLGRLEFGYLNQLVFKGNGVDVENNHTLQIGLSSTLDFFMK